MIKYTKSRTILRKSDSEYDFFGHDYYFNIYRGCSHGCIYCDSRSSCYHVENFDSEVIVKENVVELLNRELTSKKVKSVIGISGAMCDVYMPIEKQLGYTRKCLEVIDRQGFAVQIHTKNDLILKDIDLIKSINEKTNANVLFTITAFNDRLSKRIEPRAPITSRRLFALKRMSDEGITTGLAIWPTLPFLTDDETNIKNLIEVAYRYGASYVLFYPGVTLRDNQRDYFYERLNYIKSGLVDKYKERFGNSYECLSPNAAKLMEIYHRECKKYNLKTYAPHYRFDKPVQLKLF